MTGGAKLRHPVPWFHRVLHRSYGRGTRLSFFIANRVTPAAWVVMSVVLMTVVLGMDIEKSTLYQLAVIGSALMGVGFVWALLRRARLQVVRTLPTYATAGEDCRYVLEVENVGSRTLRGFWLWDRPVDPRPDLLTFTSIREPGEEQRNFFDRRFIYYRWRWLIEGRIPFTGGRSGGPMVVRPGQRLQVSVSFEPKRRGLVRLTDLRAVLPDPFGLFQRCVRVKAASNQVVVLPRRYRLPPLDLQGESSLHMGGEAVSPAVGHQGEILGLRDYRSGDPLRHIHWKGWAKAGKPIVKEFEDTYFPRYGLVLDNCVADGDAEVFEEAVSVAASFASSIDTRRSLLDLMFVNEEAIVVTAGQGIARPEKMLEALAAVEPGGQTNFEELRRLVQGYRDEFSACICVFPTWSAERAEFLRGLAGGGLEVIGLIVCREAGKVRRQLADDAVSCRCLLLEHDKVQEGLLKL